MREEEKLARDVYNVLYTTWGQPTFQNIASSEQQHMDQIKLLLDRYALTDPALAPGQFTDPTLQALYDQLVAQGSASLADALKVGAAIEEIDILDLQTRIAQTDNADIQLVYNNLMSGSNNHLQAFTSVLTQQTGEVYQPQYLSADVYQSIITNSAGNSNQGGSNGNGYGGNGQGNGGQNGQGGNSTQSQAGSGIPQATITGASTVHGVVNSFDLMGMSLTLDDGSSLYIQLGNSRYSQSIGFAPATGAGVTVTGFPGDQGLYSAITVTLDSTGQVFTFRSETGQPLWSGGNGKGNGGNH
jgi:rubrerythrin